MDSYQEIERILQIQSELMRQRDQILTRLRSMGRTTRAERIKAQLILRQVRNLVRLIATHDRQIERLRTTFA